MSGTEACLKGHWVGNDEQLGVLDDEIEVIKGEAAGKVRTT